MDGWLAHGAHGAMDPWSVAIHPQQRIAARPLRPEPRTFAIDRRNRTTWKLKSTVNHRTTRACLRWVAIRRHEYELLDERRRCRPQSQWRGLQPPQRPQHGREHARPQRVHGHAHGKLCRPVAVPEPTDPADAEWRHAKCVPFLQQPRLSNESCS
ncbi:hypothetical protein V498_10266, partial [Pseudogymnoascus sp. VKM F-4517 (FW-2822)]